MQPLKGGSPMGVERGVEKEPWPGGLREQGPTLGGLGPARGLEGSDCLSQKARLQQWCYL